MFFSMFFLMNRFVQIYNYKASPLQSQIMRFRFVYEWLSRGCGVVFGMVCLLCGWYLGLGFLTELTYVRIYLFFFSELGVMGTHQNLTDLGFSTTQRQPVPRLRAAFARSLKL